jgi:hypothetical protein
MLGLLLADPAYAQSADADRRALSVRLRAAADQSAADRARLAGLWPGMPVQDARGARVGIVRRIERTGGTIRSVMIGERSGSRRVAPRSLRVSGGVLTISEAGSAR